VRAQLCRLRRRVIRVLLRAVARPDVATASVIRLSFYTIGFDKRLRLAREHLRVTDGLLRTIDGARANAATSGLTTA